MVLSLAIYAMFLQLLGIVELGQNSLATCKRGCMKHCVIWGCRDFCSWENSIRPCHEGYLQGLEAQTVISVATPTTMIHKTGRQFAMLIRPITAYEKYQLN